MSYLRWIFVLVPALALAQNRPIQPPQRSRPPQPSQQAKTQQQQQPPGSIAGRIMSTSGEPVRKAEVVLRRMNGSSNRPQMYGGPSEPLGTTSDPSGNFQIIDLEPGQYALMVNRTGFVPLGMSRRPQIVTVGPGQAVTGVDVKLTPHAVITGKVTDEEGDPIQHAQVQVLARRYMRGRKQFMPVAGGNSTNDLGEFRISGVPPGKYIISVSRRGGPFGFQGAARNGEQEGFVTTYFPGVTDSAQASLLEVGAGELRSGMDFRLAKERVYSVRGTVLGAPAERGTHVMVMLLPAEGATAGVFERYGSDFRDGKFHIRNVPPGSYVLNAVVMRGENRSNGRAQVEVSNQNVDDVVVQLTDPISLAGQLKVDGNGVIPFSGIRVMLEPVTSFGMMAPSGGTATETGGFAVINLAPGKYKVNVSGIPQGAYIKSVKFANQESADGLVDLISPAPLEVFIGPSGAQVSGTVKTADDKPPADGTTVVLIPELSKRQREYLYKTVRVTADGQFTMQGIAPGDYSLVAFTNAEDGSWFDPEFIREYEGKAVSVKVSEGAQQTLEVRAIDLPD